MTTSPDIDFTRIAPRGGSPDHAFEELCCQLALTEGSDVGGFLRIRGDGGDGGVECLHIDHGGNMHGWQVKYIFDLDRALTKAAVSLASARRNYRALTRYVICLPFDLSGSKGRRGKSEQEKFNAFKTREENAARVAGHPISVELWSAFQLRDRLLRIDSSGGRRRFWFDVAHLGSDWFSRQLDAAILRAGPRYNPRLHHGHVLDETLAALGDTEAWRQRRNTWHSRLSQLRTKWRRAVTSKGGANSMSEEFPPGAALAGKGLQSALEAIVDSLDQGNLGNALLACQNAQEKADRIERELADDIDTRFGAGSADSTRFRQFQAEYQCAFPAQHLDDSREVLRVLSELRSWLEAPAIRANTERVLLLTGPAGIGKTHGLCDAAVQRRDAGLSTILITGSQFSPERSVWECFAAALGFDSSWSQDVILDALDAAGAVTGRLLVCVDALDERARRIRWFDDLPEFIQAITCRPNLAICIAVRDRYQRQVLRDDLDLPTFVHPGFGDAVFDACAAFFGHFRLEPPIGPLLEPEFSNPLFLLVLCRTLEACKLTSVPAGWRGTKRVLGSLLAARDDELRKQVPGAGSRAVSAALQALAVALPEGGTLSWSEADRVVLKSLPPSQQGRLELLDHLVGLGLIRNLSIKMQPGVSIN